MSTNPMPLSMVTRGRMNGSACGASTRIAMLRMMQMATKDRPLMRMSQERWPRTVYWMIPMAIMTKVADSSMRTSSMPRRFRAVFSRMATASSAVTAESCTPEPGALTTAGESAVTEALAPRSLRRFALLDFYENAIYFAFRQGTGWSFCPTGCPVAS